MNLSGISQKTWLGMALRAPLRLIPPDAVVPVLQGGLRGKKWIAGSSIHGCWLGSYEYEKQKLFERTIRKGDTVFDIGAHVGFYTLLAAELVGPTGHVFAFEPLPRNLHYLRKHLRLNQVGNVTVIEAAVTDHTGTVTFAPGNDSSSGHITTSGQYTFNAVALDDLIERGELPLPTVMKMDIEGAEALALAGCRNMLPQARPTIFLATHGAEVHHMCCKSLHSYGYQLTPIDALILQDSSEILAAHSQGYTQVFREAVD